MQFRKHLSDDGLEANNLEIAVVGSLAGMMNLANFLEDKGLLEVCTREMVGIYRESFVLEGADWELANAKAELCLKRIDQYNEVLKSHPDQWELFLSAEIAENCIGGADEDFRAIAEMMIIFEYFAKVFDGTFEKALFQQ